MDRKRRNQTAQLVLAALVTRVPIHPKAAQIAIQFANDLEEQIQSKEPAPYLEPWELIE